MVQADLDQFTGTEKYYKHMFGIKYTDGVMYLANNAKAFWLIDLVASYQGKHKNKPFQVWKLEVDTEKNSAIATMREDTNSPVLVSQRIGYTDFPLPEIKLYLIDNVLLLPSEY